MEGFEEHLAFVCVVRAENGCELEKCFFELSNKKVSDVEEYVKLQYIECRDPLDDIDKRLGCL